MRGAGRGRCGVRGGGVVTIRRQAGVRRSVTSFFSPPAAVCKGLRFELHHKEEGNYIEKVGGGSEEKGKHGVNT